MSAENANSPETPKSEPPTALFVCTGKAETTDGKPALILRELTEASELGEERIFASKGLLCRVGHIYRIQISETKGADSIFPSTERWISQYADAEQVAAWQAAARALDVEKAAARERKKAEGTQQMLEVLKPLRTIYERTNALGRLAIEVQLLAYLRQVRGLPRDA